MSGFLEGEARNQATLIPERLDYVMEDSAVRVIDVFIDYPDVSDLCFRSEPAATGRPGYRPKTLKGTNDVWWPSRIELLHGLSRKPPKRIVNTSQREKKMKSENMQAALILMTLLAFLNPLVSAAQSIRLDSVDGLRAHKVMMDVSSHRGSSGIRVTDEGEFLGNNEDKLVILDGQQFTDGVIEVSLAGAPGEHAGQAARGFVGVAFRVHNAEQPTLIVNDLKLGAENSGLVSLWIGPGTNAHFRDLRISRD